MSDQIQELLGKVGSGSNRSSKYMDRLTPGSREVLELFQKWLVESDDKSEATSRQYKVYVAQALCHIQDGGELSDLSTDVRSGLNALKRFSDSGEIPATDEDLADDIDQAGEDGNGEDEWDVSDVPLSGDTE